jgi:hypothetical protein
MVHVRDNIDGHHRRDSSEPDELVVRPDDRGFLAPDPFLPLAAEALTPEVALERVLAQAGAIAPARDRLDRQAVEDVINRTGQVIDDPAKVGGWPDLRSGPAPADSDADGMPDQWESGHGTDPRTFDAWQDADGNGWTNLEDYLNERAAAGAVAMTE